MGNTNAQASSLDEVKRVNNDSTNPEDYTLDQLLRLIRLERSSGLNQQYKSALNQLRMGQLKISILTDLRRYLNLSKDAEGKFDASAQEFQDLITKSKQRYESLSDELTKAGENLDDIETFGDLLEEVGIIEGKKTYSDEETKAVLSSIKMTTEQLGPLNEMHMQTVTRIENEINEAYQMIMAAYKPMHNAITQMAKAARGG